MMPYGCRNGACGTCKGKILDGQRRLRPAPDVDADRRRKAQRASRCSAARRPQTDLVIEVREVRRAGDIQIKRLPCRIESIDKPAPTSRSCRLKLPANERLQYLAGQYIDFLLKDGQRRSFSLATPPHADELLELHIRHTSRRLLHRSAVHEYKGREILRFEGPLGTFYLREDTDKPIDLRRGRHRLCADQGDHRAHAASPDSARDGALLGRAREARSLPARTSRKVADRASELHVHPGAVGTRGRRCVAGPHGLRAPGGARRLQRTCRATRYTRAARRQ